MAIHGRPRPCSSGTATKFGSCSAERFRSQPLTNRALRPGTLFHLWRMDGGWAQSLTANVSFLGQAWVEPTLGHTNMGRTVPNRHDRTGDRPAPNEIEFLKAGAGRRRHLWQSLLRRPGWPAGSLTLEDGEGERNARPTLSAQSRQHATVPPAWSPGAQRESARGPARQEVQFAVIRVAPSCPGGMLPVWLAPFWR